MNASSSFDPKTQALAGTTSIEASAGTGKTYSITLLWLRLLVERGLRVDQILVSTFTQAATAELRERLLDSLRRALAATRAIAEGRTSDKADAGDEARVVSAWLRAGTDPSAEPPASLTRRLTEALSAFDLAPIQTIHGFCQSLLGRHSLELACDPDLRLQENCDTLVEQITGDHVMESSDMQAPEVAVLRRLAKTLQARPAATVRGVSRTREALAADKAEVLRQIETEAPAALGAITNKSTQKAVGSRIQNLRDAGSWEKLTDPQIKALPKTFSELWSRYRQLELAESRLPATGLADRLRKDLPDRKALAGLRTFDDILLTVRDALTAQGPDGPLARAVRGRLKAAILDECQDSDTLQIEVFQTLFNHPDTEAFLIIGDPKQSIYRFRGADLASYRSLALKATAAPPMTVNHRSDPSLVRAINHLYGSGFRFPDSLAGNAPFEYVPVTAQAADDRIQDPAHRRALILLWSPESDRTRAPARLAASAATEIARLLRDPVTISDRHAGHPRRLTPGDIGVLAANHRELQGMRRALQARGIPCQSSGKGLGSVFASDEALDVLGWLELLSALHHHGDLLGRLSAFLLSPLGATPVEALLRIQDDPGLQAGLFQGFQQAGQELSRVGPLPPLLRWIAAPPLSTHTLGHADGERRLTNWRQLGTLLQGRFESGIRSAESLAAWLSRQIAEAPESIEGASGESALMRLETDASAVQLNTIHGAKGLEYPVVFCPFLCRVAGRARRGTPAAAVARIAESWVIDVGSDAFEVTLEAAESQEAEEESRRLYVALTRARHRLYLGMAPIAAHPKSTGNNSAAESPLARLPGLRSDSMETWPACWKALEAHGIQCLDPAEAPEAPERSEAAPTRAPTRVPDAGGVVTGPATGAPRELQRPPCPRPYPFPLFAIRSFTSLSRSDTDHEPTAADRDLAAAQEPESAASETRPTSDGLALLGTAGSILGDQLHRALEDHLGNGRPLDQAVASYDPAEAWQRSLEAILDTALEPTPGVRFRLSELQRQCITEMQFHLPVDRIDAKTLAARLSEDPRLRSMPGGQEWAKSLAGWGFTEFSGFLQGFIDLVFERDGRWYVADYKSNRLDRYDPEALDRAMLRSHYFLQARIYLLALHRHLQAHLPDYDPERHLGGVMYLFVRGFPDQGVWWDRPCPQALRRLDDLFSGKPDPVA